MTLVSYNLNIVVDVAVLTNMIRFRVFCPFITKQTQLVSPVTR